MAWRILSTTDNQHVGEVLEHVEPGQLITFQDGDVVSVDRIFTSEDGNEIVVISVNYQMTLVKE